MHVLLTQKILYPVVRPQCIHHQKIFHAMNTLYKINCQNTINSFTSLGCQCHVSILYNDNSPFQWENEPGNQSMLEIQFPSSSRTGVKIKFFYFLSPKNRSENKKIFIFSPRKNGGENKKFLSSLPKKRERK